MIPALWSLLPVLAVLGHSVPALPQNLTLTALVGKKNLSSLECWALTPALVESTAMGTVGALSYSQLGGTVNGSYALFTQLTNSGLHNASAPQYVIILAGRGELSFPSANPSDPILGGNYTLLAGDIIIAADIAELGLAAWDFNSSDALHWGHTWACRVT
ncbi:hypothetical protein K438DRAFT_1760469 [Mycena galopus ATCC 62051]|nr:hypothetical protein K438DRAFT_1760469 [Mycena galopus ATCC 62051]